MVWKFTSDGRRYGVPPYTKAEEDELYRQAELKGSVTILRGPVSKGDDSGRESGGAKPAIRPRDNPDQG